MTFFKQWTKKQLALGIGLVVVLVLTVVAYTLVTDYEDAKSTALSQVEAQLNDLKIEHRNEAQSTQVRMDEQLLQSSDEGLLTQDAQFRQKYIQLQEAFLALVTAEESDAYVPEASETLIAEGVGSDRIVSLYVDDESVSSGLAYVMGQPTKVFAFTYTDGVIDTFTHVADLDSQQVQIETEEE